MNKYWYYFVEIILKQTVCIKVSVFLQSPLNANVLFAVKKKISYTITRVCTIFVKLSLCNSFL